MLGFSDWHFFHFWLISKVISRCLSAMLCLRKAKVLTIWLFGTQTGKSMSFFLLLNDCCTVVVDVKTHRKTSLNLLFYLLYINGIILIHSSHACSVLQIHLHTWQYFIYLRSEYTLPSFVHWIIHIFLYSPISITTIYTVWIDETMENSLLSLIECVCA